MFAILDTNHISAVDRSKAVAEDFQKRIKLRGGSLFVTVISVEEVMRGWLALLSSRKKKSDELPVYERLKRSTEMFASWDILPWDAESLELYESLRKQRLKMSSADMKIASIALAHEAVLLTQNRQDFERVPNLQIEDWLA